VKLHINVLGPGMVNWVVSQGPSRLIVNVEGNGLARVYEIEIQEQGPKSDKILRGIASAYVHGGCSNDLC
jgi:hypothetical protein